MKKNISSSSRIIYGIILALSIVAYSMVFINRNFTMSEGWAFFYSNLIDNGKVPYRDFYYYLPPLNLLIDFIIWKLSDGLFIIYRLIRLAERVAIAEIMYRVISERVDYFISLIACFTGAVMGASTALDLMGDYNQTTILLCALMCLLMYKYINASGNTKKRCILMAAIGVTGGCMLLCKQTIVVAEAIVFAVFFLLLIIAKVEKKPFAMIASVFSGAMIPVGITLIYTLATDSLSEFINQVFIDMDSKGSLLDIIVINLLKTVFFNKECVVAIILITATIFLCKYKDKVKLSDKSVKIISIIIYIASAAVIIKANFTNITNTANVLTGNIFTIIMLATFAVILTVNTDRIAGKAVVILSCALLISLTLTDFNNISTQLSNGTTFDTLFGKVFTWVFFALAFWIVVQVIIHFAHNTPLPLDAMVVVASALAMGWSLDMAAASDRILNSWGFIIVPATAYVLFRNKQADGTKLRKITSIVCVIIICSCAYERIIVPYTWWGYKSSPIAEQTYTSDIRAIKGFTFNEEEYRKFDTLTKIIKDNTDDKSVIFGFPYTKVYNVMLDNYNMNNFVPVLFYDVSSSSYAKKDAELLAQNEPDIVVWHDIDNCLEAHEKIYMNAGQLGHRDIIKWFAGTKDDNYVLIGQVDDIFVYKHIKAGKPVTTFIEDESKVNITAQKDYFAK